MLKSQERFTFPFTWTVVMTVLLISSLYTNAFAEKTALNIVETAKKAGKFRILAKALQKGNLLSALQKKGPFTVFAPTDKAFSRVPKKLLNQILKDREKLRKILTYHVIAGRYNAKRILQKQAWKTISGHALPITRSGAVRVGKAKVLQTDIKCSNGVIHVIDRVLLPPADLLDVIEKTGKMKTFLKLVQVAGLRSQLRQSKSLTLFIPTDKAFGRLPKKAVAALLRNPERLRAVLRYHVLPGKKKASSLLRAFRAKTAEGSSISLGLTVNGFRILTTDLSAHNGVIHVLDGVLIPKIRKKNDAERALAFIKLAIDRGVPLYNNGYPGACASIYELAVRGLLDGYQKQLSAGLKARLKKSLRKIRMAHSANAQAWILRYALDAARSHLTTVKSRMQARAGVILR